MDTKTNKTKSDYRSKSVAFRYLADSPDPNANKLYALMNSHPAREHIRLGPLWSDIYKMYAETSINIPMARKKATITVLGLMNTISLYIDPFFIPILLD